MWRTSRGCGTKWLDGVTIRKATCPPFSNFLSSHKDRRTFTVPDVRWSDVGSLARVRVELANTIELPLHRLDLFVFNNESRLSRGLLLWGPPGTSKTLVAKAVATE